jgi:hypothetical protein
MNNLKVPEFAILAEKINQKTIPVIFLRGNLFNPTVRDVKIYKQPKVFYEDKDNIFTTTLNLNQKHKEVLLYLLYNATKSDIRADGSFDAKISLYNLAKTLGYKRPRGSNPKVKKLLDELQMTVIKVKSKTSEKGFTFNLIDRYYFDNLDYVIQIPAEIAQYIAYTTTVHIPEVLVYKLFTVKNARINALITYLYANRISYNGIKLDTVCKKLGIIKANRISEFKADIKDNTELLSEFGIILSDDKFTLSKDIGLKFYHALSESEIEAYEQKQLEREKPQIINAKTEVLITNTLGQQEQIPCIICDVVYFDRNKKLWQPIAQEANNPEITYPLTPAAKEELEQKFKIRSN